MEILEIDHVEIYVGNAYQSAHFYRAVLGFQIIAHTGPETGLRHATSYAIRQGGMTLVLTSAVDDSSFIAKQVSHHGEGVRDIALTVRDAREAFAAAVTYGARPLAEPKVLEDESGKVITATISTFGDAVHTFIERGNYRGTFLPGYRDLRTLEQAQAGLEQIDHFAVAVKPEGTAQWAQFYQDIFGCHLLLEEYTTTSYSSMRSKVVRDTGGKLKLVFVEPAPGIHKSPIEEFLLFYCGEGVHHIALTSSDIVRSVSHLYNHGLEFTLTPSTYYDSLTQRVGSIAEKIEDLRELGILADRDEGGYLLQIFSQPIQSRPTFFYEIIQRAGAQGFGNGNIKALFEAIERAQLLRGNI